MSPDPLKNGEQETQGQDRRNSGLAAQHMQIEEEKEEVKKVDEEAEERRQFFQRQFLSPLESGEMINSTAATAIEKKRTFNSDSQ